MQLKPLVFASSKERVCVKQQNPYIVTGLTTTKVKKNHLGIKFLTDDYLKIVALLLLFNKSTLIDFIMIFRST